MTDAAIIKPSELAPRVNLLSAVSRLIREDIGNWARTPDKKPLLQQVREAADLWRIYRYVPYHYLKYDLFRRSIGETYRDYPPSIVADFFVYQMNPKECIDWLEDKLEFDARMRRIGLPFVATLATLELHGDRLRIESRGGAPLSWPELHALVREAAPHGAFLKPRFGLGGKGAFRLSVEEGGFVRDGRVQSEADIAERMRASGYDQFMLQPYFLQHPDVARVHPGSVNTLRILTFRSDDDVEIIASYLRVGGAGAETDNGSGGGFAAKVDLATGRVGSVATIHLTFAESRFVERHPETGVAFGDITIPHAQAIAEYVTQGARAFAPLRVIGWDIAVGPDGPCAVEANSIPGFRPVQDVCGGLRRTRYGEAMAAHFGWGRRSEDCGETIRNPVSHQPC